MINPTVRAAIFQLTSVSQNARTIANRLKLQAKEEKFSAQASSTVEELEAQVADLTEQLQTLRSQVSALDAEDDEAEMSEHDQQEFTRAFSEGIEGMRFGVAESVYDIDYFEPYSRQKRMLMCTALVEWCNTNKLKPTTLWYSIMVNNGSIGSI